jgi:LysR family transcriptional activator of nhaA
VNFKHLYHFWMTARTGSIKRAGLRLHLTPQTLSSQIKVLEERLGCQLFERTGRNLRLTDAGRLAATYAEEIFLLGSQLEDALRTHATTDVATSFKVGVADSIPESIAQQLLRPLVPDQPGNRVICRDGGLSALLQDLSGARLDLVLADTPIPAGAGTSFVSHRLGRYGLMLFGAARFVDARTTPFPECLNGMAMLMPRAGSALKRKLETWISETRLRPHVIGEVDDWTLMTTLAREGKGVFAAPAMLEAQLLREHGVRPLGAITGVFDEFYAISVKRKSMHPSTSRLPDTARPGEPVFS